MTKELARRPTRPTAAPPTAVTRHPRTSVKTLTIGEQKKIIPMEREPTHAAGDTNTNTHTRTLLFGNDLSVSANGLDLSRLVCDA